MQGEAIIQCKAPAGLANNGQSILAHPIGIGHRSGMTMLPARLFLTALLMAAFSSQAGGVQNKALPDPLCRLTVDDAAVSRAVSDLVTRQLADQKIAGAVVGVVCGDRTVLLNGYGYADVAQKTPVDPARTMFRLGSLSKMLTSVAVMQLVDAGKLHLDRDVNAYLDFTVPTPRGGLPVTLRRLLTHRAGFEEQFKGQVVAPGAQLAPLGEFLRKNQPVRLFPKADVPAYSNYGFTLAGYIVERVSGEAFAHYVDAHIFKPLGLAHSSFEQPLPHRLSPYLSREYRDAREPAAPDDQYQHVAAAGMSASGGDMTRLTQLLLDSKRLEALHVLSQASYRRLLEPQETAPPGMNRMLLGWMERSVGDIHLVGHSGETLFSRASLVFDPATGFGMFVAYNTPGRGSVPPAEALLIAVCKQVFGQVSRPIPGRTAPGGDLRDVLGTYQASRRSESSFMKFLALLDQTNVSAGPHDTIVLEGSVQADGKPRLWEEVGPLRFAALDAPKQVAFERDPDGVVRTVRFNAPGFILQRVPFYLDRKVVYPVSATAAAILLLALLGWPVEVAMRRRAKGARLHGPGCAVRFPLRVLALLALAALLAAGGLNFLGASDPAAFGPALDPMLIVVYGLSWLVCIGQLWTGALVLQTWMRRSGTELTRVHDTLVWLALLVVTSAMLCWHLAGTTLTY